MPITCCVLGRDNSLTNTHKPSRFKRESCNLHDLTHVLTVADKRSCISISQIHYLFRESLESHHKIVPFFTSKISWTKSLHSKLLKVLPFDSSFEHTSLNVPLHLAHMPACKLLHCIVMPPLAGICRVPRTRTTFDCHPISATYIMRTFQMQFLSFLASG